MARSDSDRVAARGWFGGYWWLSFKRFVSRTGCAVERLAGRFRQDLSHHPGDGPRHRLPLLS